MVYIIAIGVMTIGAIIFLSPAIKLYVLGFDTPTYFNVEDNCYHQMQRSPEMKISIDIPLDIPYKTYEECVEKRTKSESQRYVRRKKEQMVDGFITFLVGGLLYVMHRREVFSLVKGDKKE